MVDKVYVIVANLEERDPPYWIIGVFSTLAAATEVAGEMNRESDAAEQKRIRWWKDEIAGRNPAGLPGNGGTGDYTIVEVPLDVPGVFEIVDQRWFTKVTNPPWWKES